MRVPLSVLLRPVFLIVFFLALTTAAYFKIARGEFLYDDIELILGNAQLAGVSSLRDVFSFSYKPSRPISDFAMALGEWLSPRRSTGQRAISFLVHALTAYLLLQNLLLLRLKLAKNIPPAVCYMTAILFCVNPIHSETIAIAQFRMEMLGAFFSLLALWAFQRRFEGEHPIFWSALMVLSLGGAALSKETYLAVAPGLIFLASLFYRRAVVTAGELVLYEVFWAWILYTKLQVEPQSARPYRDILGYHVITPIQHLSLSSHAFLEGIGKVFSGQNLTIVALHERLDFAKGSAIGENLIPLLGYLLFLVIMWRRPGWTRFCAGFLAISSLPYLLIPNLNIGSEHYWYLGVAAVWFTILTFIWQFQNSVSDKAPGWFLAFAAAFVIILTVNLERRVRNMDSRLAFYFMELTRNPAIPSRWVDMAATMMESPKKDIAELAHNFLSRARELDPNNPLLVSNEYFYAVLMNDRYAAIEKYNDLMRIYHDHPEKKESFGSFWRKRLGDSPDQLSFVHGG